MTTDENNAFHRSRLRREIAALRPDEIADPVPPGVDVEAVRAMLLEYVGQLGPHDELTDLTGWGDILIQMARDYDEDSLIAAMIGY